MADKKITQLNNITGANLAEADEFVVVDITADETKAITFSELKTAFDTSTGFVRITGDTMTGNLSFGDNDKAIFGAGSDLQIYHDGSDSYIDEAGTGNLRIRASSTLNLQTRNTADTAWVNSIIADDGAGVRLFTNGSKKLETTSTGIDVTGTVTSDGLTVQTTNGLGALLESTGTSYQYLQFKNTAEAQNYLGFVGDDFTVTAGNTKYLQVEGNGDISFYEDTGTTPKFHWDASAERLGIGTDSPSSKLHINNTAGNDGLRIINSTTGEGYIIFGDTADANTGSIAYNHTEDAMAFDVNNSEAMRIDSSGRVGIGTSSPSEKLHVQGDGADILLTDLGGGQTAKLGSTGSNNGLLELNNSSHTSKVFLNTSGDSYFNGGNVGIGTSSPAVKLEVFNSGNSQMRLSTSASGALKVEQNTNGAFIGTTSTGASAGVLRLGTGDAERMRIDSSGNLLVGNTAYTGNTTNSGGGIRSDGLAFASVNGGSAAVFNRISTDGDIALFRKDGATVGSISSSAGRLAIGTGNTGLFFDSIRQVITPHTMTGNTYNTALDLGRDAIPFKDAYLSGGVYLGGTGSANKLDDYEEGSFSAALTATSSGTITLNSSYDTFFYTKIGNLVHISGYIRISSVSSPTGVIRFTLPFTVANLGDSSNAVLVYANNLASGSVSDMWAECSDNTSYVYIYAGGGTGVSGTSAQQTQAATDFRISGTYKTNA